MRITNNPEEEQETTESVWNELEAGIGTKSFGRKGAQPHYDIARLQRENQSLQLENILLERQLKNLLDVIRSDSELEALFLRQMEEQRQKERGLSPRRGSYVE